MSEIKDGMLKGTSGDSVANPSISFVGADPKDTEILSCVPKDADNTCYIFKGEMTAVHDDKISAEDVNAIKKRCETGMTVPQAINSILNEKNRGANACHNIRSTSHVVDTVAL